MTSKNEIIKDIEEQKVGNSAKKVLLVEGSDDVQVISAFLDKGKPGWENNWVVAEAQSKKNVLKIAKMRQSWICVVDRDEWSAEIIAEKLQENHNLWVLPRFCIENYLIVPSELWAAFPPKQQAKVNGGLTALENMVTADLDKWVAHGALWATVNPLWQGLRSLGFKEDLLNPEISLDDATIKETLKQWHNFLEPEKIWRDYQTKLEEITILNQEDKLKIWVHGKKFYKGVINLALNELLGSKDKADRKKAIFRTLQLPEDLASLFEKMEI